jgi:hypothetical protein
MHDARWPQLKAILLADGWTWRDDTLYAPRETMWFTTNSESPNYAQFRDRMTQMCDVAGSSADVDHQAFHADLVSLVAALDAVLDGN